MNDSPPGISFWREALLTVLIATLLGAFVHTNPGFLDLGNGEQWHWQRSPGIVMGDSGYHIRMGWLYRTGEAQAAGPNFHWTRLSVWNGRFSDKDFLYHIYLIPFTGFARDAWDHDGLVKGAKVASAAGYGLLALALLCALRLAGVRPAWPFVLLVAATSWLFLLRMMEARSWAFSAACAVLGWVFLLRGNRAAVFCTGVVYTLSYTASHILVVLAVFQLAARLVLGPDAGSSRRADLRRNAALLGMAVLGLAAGTLLHPQPLELVRLWWVQNVLVLYMHSGGEVTGLVASISQAALGWERVPRDLALPPQLFGAELRPPAAYTLWAGCGAALALPVLMLAGALVLRCRPARDSLMSMAIAAGLLALVARSIRFTEYALPFAALACGLWTRDFLASARLRAWLSGARRAVARRVATGVLAAAALAQLLVLRHEVPFLPLSMFPTMVAWLESHDEVRGKLVYNLSWDSFPDLFLVRSDCDYAAGLDPAFVAAAGTRQSQVFINLSLGRVHYVAGSGAELAEVIRTEIGADYLFVTRFSNPVLYDGLQQMAGHGLIQTVFIDETAGCALFRVRP